MMKRRSQKEHEFIVGQLSKEKKDAKKDALSSS